MKRAWAGLGTMAAVTAAAVVGIAPPAGATVTVTTSGTTVTVSLTGTETANIACAGGVVTVNTKTGSPAVSCAALTKLTVNGDGGAQDVDGRQLEYGVFAAKPYLVANLGDGVDLVWDTTRADQIDMGPGDDNLYLVRGVANTSVDLGAGTGDTIRFFGTDADEELTASSSNNVVTINHELNGVLRTLTATNAEDFQVGAYEGDNVVDLSGITLTSTIKRASIYTGSGDDVVRAPQFTGAQYAQGPTISAGAGNNQIFGGTGNDNILSEGNGDVIKAGAGYNRITDRRSPRSGRTLDNDGTSNWYFLDGDFGDAIVRLRPNGSAAKVTTSLTRPGQQLLGNSYTNVSVNLVAESSADARGLVDLVAFNGSRDVYTHGDDANNDLLDITIPTGSWNTAGNPATNYLVTPTAPGYAPIHIDHFGTVNVHGPWANLNAGFVHRVTRDLVFRFATSGTISSLGTALGNGGTTRAKIVADLMDSDEYRHLDVERVFTRYLDRKVDPGGLTYWTNSIRNGKPLWRFRAQLFGSNEYFTKAGGTNAAYLDAVYKDVLGRLPDPSGRAYWTAKLNSGTDRGGVALKFINSAEFRRYLIDDQFLRFLDRRPTAGEQTTWVNTLTSSPTGEQDLIAYLATTAEYFNRN
jgi:hypothetical protein